MSNLEKNDGAAAPDDAGTREFYTQRRDHMQKKMIEAARKDAAFFQRMELERKAFANMIGVSSANVPLQSNHPTMIRRKAQATAAAQGLKGAYDLNQHGKCGETAFTCTALFQAGTLACNGGWRNTPTGGREYMQPCPLRDFHMPISSGLHMVKGPGMKR